MKKSASGRVRGGKQPRNEWWAASLSTPEVQLPEGVSWYSISSSNDSIKVVHAPTSAMSSSELAEIQKQIEVHVTRETERYHQYKKKNLSADDKWMNDVIKSGTLSDKVAALALKVSSAPFHEMQTLDILLAMALKKEQRVSQLALEALKDLLVHNLLPDRKLIPFKSRDLVNAGLLDGMLYWFEDKLMQKFSSVLDALDGGIKSNVDFFKKTCLGIILDLLASKPEQEQRLLMMLVNKLGDHVASFSSNVTQHLKTLLSKHPAMKIVVAKEVRQFIFRANVSSKSLYSGICFLNQINLVTSDHKVAELLMEIFIQMFDKVVNDKDMSSKLLAALLTGINKSYPVLKNHDVIEKHIDTLFRVVHTGTFSASTQALSLISLMALDDSGRANKSRKNSEAAVEKSGSDGDLKSRYYRALYEKLLSEQIMSRARNVVFLNLLYRSMKADGSDKRVSAFMKRLCILTTQASSSISAGLLFLLSEMCAAKPEALRLLTASEGEEATEHLGEYFHLGSYDAVKREPEYACSAAPSSWELSLVRNHFHPSVAAFTNNLLAPPHKIEFNGDPTVEFSLMSFLSRFTYKNAKANKVRALKSRVVNEDAINSAEFLESNPQAVAPDKTFFHRFFGDRVRLMEKGLVRNRKKRARSGSDGDEGDDEDAIDVFADKLAEDLLTSAGGDDPDMDDVDDDDMDDADDDFTGGDFEDDFEDGEDDASMVDFDDENSGEEDGSEGGDFEGLTAYGDDASQDDYKQVKVQKSITKSKPKAQGKTPKDAKAQGVKGKVKNVTSDFADAKEYEDIMEEIVRFHSQQRPEGDVDGAVDKGELRPSATKTKKQKLKR